ncbi:YaaC family protein [Fusobacterium vincentii]|uniref:YaaC family protein n=1 Tax=Fusobacterium vincentii TaxID=155615 RepID=UPI0030CD9DF7
MAIKTLEINSKVPHLMKPVTNADYTAKTVLTNSAWEYVELWLKRQKTTQGERALFYWKQAYNFFKASECLSIESRPLTVYYCCLNATKALLKMKGNSNFDTLGHGITSARNQWNNNNIKYAEVIFLGSGVLFELLRYLEEEAVKKYIQYMICFIILYVFIGLFQLPINVQNYLYQLEM